ncbi:MAG: GFA family protein, partial [Alphaproteobacteria bacterium]|nr:GFA family protein [Alphaproteobacteria bacterium]
FSEPSAALTSFLAMVCSLYKSDRTNHSACHGRFVTQNLFAELSVHDRAPESVKLDSPSGHPHEVFLCKACSTNLWSKYHAVPYEILYVRGGTLDDSSKMPRPVHIFTRSKQAWFKPPESARAFPGFYEVEDVWPAESLERLNEVAV